MNLADDTAPRAAKLPDPYDCCLLGASVDLHQHPRFAYSLVKLIRFEKTRLQCSVAEARQSIADEFITPIQRECGPLAPLFIDDELVQGEVEEKQGPKLVLPGQDGFNMPPRN